ncbi:TPA: IdeS/Mac family cysteine endopeptidase [Streptococcus equi subsp. zooepidemicus]|nr:IdeS/Mac family cysteine endopeptidase [Streptococcus equi subsp. zooepidemicus]HEL0393671.1 IdeS/Mac family cysteine endopeptidase [Streptococcus equi subsp. zooepidemicus]HEL0397671.1 IdeS/Mac family cysteine endopeptidase [Streptococcus equi subsp. zooepidemicus]
MKKQSFTHSRKPKFGMRKLSIGLASCMLGMMFLTTSHVSGEVVEVWPYGQNPNGKTEILSQTEDSESSQRLRDIEDFQAEKKMQNVVYTKWLDGVDVKDHDFRKIVDGNIAYYATPLLNGRGFYDINKDFNRDSDKCAAAVAANMFHYWLDINRDNVDRFLRQNPEKHGIIELPDGQLKLSDFLNTYESDHGYRDKSKLFDFISNNFNGPVWTDKLLDNYINGYAYNYKYGRTIEDPTKNTSKINFFKEVFNEKILTNNHSIRNQNEFSVLLSEALYTGKAIGLSYGPAGLRHSLGHIISVWGADLDADGNVVAIYVTDSDDKKLTIGDERVGLKQYKISTDDENRLRLTAYEETHNTGGQIRGLWTLDTGKYAWADYFDKTEQTGTDQAEQ